MCRPTSIGFALKALNNQIKRMMDRRAGCQGDGRITGMQHGVIHFIARHSQEGEVFQRDLEEEFNIRRSTATGILQLMERNGLIVREPVARDARLKKLVLTEKGLEYRQRAMEEIAELERKMIQGISEEDLQVFFRVIDAMSRNIDCD